MSLTMRHVHAVRPRFDVPDARFIVWAKTSWLCRRNRCQYGCQHERYCGPYKGLPSGTETAVVYYLPPDRDQGFLDSSFVLNRSAEVEEGDLARRNARFRWGPVGPE